MLMAFLVRNENADLSPEAALSNARDEVNYLYGELMNGKLNERNTLGVLCADGQFYSQADLHHVVLAPIMALPAGKRWNALVAHFMRETGVDGEIDAPVEFVYDAAVVRLKAACKQALKGLAAGSVAVRLYALRKEIIALEMAIDAAHGVFPFSTRLLAPWHGWPVFDVRGENAGRELDAEDVILLAEVE